MDLGSAQKKARRRETGLALPIADLEAGLIVLLLLARSAVTPPKLKPLKGSKPALFLTAKH